MTPCLNLLRPSTSLNPNFETDSYKEKFKDCKQKDDTSSLKTSIISAESDSKGQLHGEQRITSNANSVSNPEDSS